MNTRLKQYDAKFKASVAIEALGNSSVLEVSAKYKLPKTNVREWKEKLISGAESIFVQGSAQNKVERLLKEEVEKLHKIIGEITVENNFYKKKLLK